MSLFAELTIVEQESLFGGKGKKGDRSNRLRIDQRNVAGDVEGAITGEISGNSNTLNTTVDQSNSATVNQTNN